jgi:hypothetical protein
VPPGVARARTSSSIFLATQKPDDRAEALCGFLDEVSEMTQSLLMCRIFHVKCSLSDVVTSANNPTAGFADEMGSAGRIEIWDRVVI